MATYSQVKKGAKGGAVSELQKLLNQNGYSLSVDENFGSNTESAVRDYQQKNGLTVDGIVGNETWSSLFNSGNAAPASPQNASTNWLASYEGNRPSYQQSQAVSDAAEMLSQYEGNRPGDYQPKYGDQIQSMLDKILNREDFSYDFNADPLYKQYADRFQQQGKMAMMDTMGNAAALSGGYGNSYAQTAGQQTYQGYLQELNDVIPELRNAAYQMYQDEGTDMRNDLSTLQGLDESDYGRYRDDVNDYYTDLNYYYNKYNDMSESEYNRYLSDVSAWENDRAFWYAKQQDDQAQSNWEKEYALAAEKASSSGPGSPKSSDDSTIHSALLDEINKANMNGATQADIRNYLADLYNSEEVSENVYKAADAYAISLNNTSVISESEFNRSPAMQKQYGSYAKYLRTVRGM